jgi:hypothetical protein
MEPQKILTKVYTSQPQWLDPERVENKWLKTGDPGDMASDTKEIELPGPNGTVEKYLYSEMGGEWVKKARNLNRVVKYPATVEVIDYDKEILRVSGAVINRFMKYRAILWAHNHSMPVNGNVPVIGNAIRMKKDVTSKPHKLYIWPEFIPPETNSFADNVFGHIKGGWMPSGSLGFWPTETNYGDVEKQGWRREIVKWFFIEFSPCPVGCNYEVLVELEKAYADQYGHEKSLWPGYSFGEPLEKGLPRSQEICVLDGDGFCKAHPELETLMGKPFYKKTEEEARTEGIAILKDAGEEIKKIWAEIEALKNVLEKNIIPRLAVSKPSRPDEDPAGKAAGSKASEKTDDEAGVNERLKQAGDRLVRVNFEPDKKEGGYSLGRLLRDCVGDLPEGTPEGGEKDDGK